MYVCMCFVYVCVCVCLLTDKKEDSVMFSYRATWEKHTECVSEFECI